MAKPKRYYYEVVYTCDLPFYAPDQRKERWPRRGRRDVQPQSVLHCIRVHPSPGFNARGDALEPDYIVTDRKVGNTYTEEVVRSVSRPGAPGTGQRSMRPKTSKIKLQQVEPDEVNAEIRRTANDLPWGDELFKDHTADVVLPEESAALAARGARVNALPGVTG